VKLRWALIAWIAAANGLDAAWTLEALRAGVPELNPLLTGIADSAWLLAAKVAAVGVLCAVNIAAGRAGGRPAAVFTAGLVIAAVWYAGVTVWHLADRG